MEKLTKLDNLSKEKKRDQEEHQRQKERNKIIDKNDNMERDDEWNHTSVCKISNKGEEETTWCTNSTAETVQNWEQKTNNEIRIIAGVITWLLPKREWEPKFGPCRIITKAFKWTVILSMWRWTPKNRTRANGFKNSDSIKYSNEINKEYKQGEWQSVCRY